MTLHELNHLPPEQLKQELLRCCGSNAWAEKMLGVFPAEDYVDLMEDAEEKWYECSEEDWKEAFSHHPKIGEVDALREKFASTAQWASSEQSGVNTAPEEALNRLSEGNRRYEDKFGYIFIVCATGKSAEEMLALLESRINNEPGEELEIAADQQMQITKLRLDKLINS
ncbi:MAG: uraD [Chitinophagaceae bacterium]|jgi:2-oxo-4-hydroxy-4-carboxy-5-ureidoimidazoline decarboxylase|nr:uraD [Chitinophagaceae bacterium]